MIIDVKSLALGVIETYESNNPFVISESLEISILLHDLPTELDGYRLDDIIVLNKNKNYDHQKWVLAHEIGHYLLHEDISYGLCYTNKLLVYKKYEKQADIFASELLLYHSDKYELEGLTKEQISALYKVPVKFIEYAFNQ